MVFVTIPARRECYAYGFGASEESDWAQANRLAADLYGQRHDGYRLEDGRTVPLADCTSSEVDDLLRLLRQVAGI